MRDVMSVMFHTVSLVLLSCPHLNVAPRCSLRSSIGLCTWSINREYWWNLVWKPSVEQLRWETRDRLVRAKDGVETVYCAVIHLVFSSS